MIYYVIKNKDGFEELVFEGTMEEAEAKKIALESLLSLSEEDQKSGWSRIKYYIFPETGWKMEIGGMH
jgi:20S proteasome alpha/beta subunit